MLLEDASSDHTPSLLTTTLPKDLGNGSRIHGISHFASSIAKFTPFS